jgi:hypothetical protein
MSKYWLESFKLGINVLYTYSNDEFKKGYDKLKSKYINVNFVFESDFKKDLLSLIKKKEFTIFAVDDQIFKEDFSINCDEVKQFERNDKILGLSLRLHPNLTYCYAANTPMRKLESCLFEWKNETGDANYPMSLDTTMFRTKDIKPLLEVLNYKNPNSLEAMLASYPINRPKMLCFNKAITINNPCNKVQTNNHNRFGNISQEYLNEKYINGERISLSNIDGIDNIACHTELEVLFEKENE